VVSCFPRHRLPAAAASSGIAAAGAVLAPKGVCLLLHRLLWPLLQLKMRHHQTAWLLIWLLEHFRYPI
jgi:hypothetical protein